MGTWSSPTTVAKAAELGRLMENPIPARDADDALYDLMGDDGLFDMIVAAREVGRDCDVRGLVVAKLDEWLNWKEPAEWTRRWEPGAEERLIGIFDGYRGSICESDVLHSIVRFPGEKAARDAVAWALDLDARQAKALEVKEWVVPNVLAVVTPDDRVFRFDSVDGCSVEAPADRRLLILNELRAGRPSSESDGRIAAP